MGTQSRACAVARHGVTAVGEAALVVAIVAALVVTASVLTNQAPGGAGDVSAAGRLSATISFGDNVRAASASAGSSVSFAVSRSVPDNDPVMWVTQKCYDAAGKLVSWHDRAVEWGAWSSLGGQAGPYVVSGDHCKAYATLRPWRSSVLGDAQLEYGVGG